MSFRNLLQRGKWSDGDLAQYIFLIKIGRNDLWLSEASCRNQG